MTVWLIGIAAVGFLIFVAWALCRAAKEMDEMFDALDHELYQRQHRRAHDEPRQEL